MINIKYYGAMLIIFVTCIVESKDTSFAVHLTRHFKLKMGFTSETDRFSIGWRCMAGISVIT